MHLSALLNFLYRLLFALIMPTGLLFLMASCDPVHDIRLENGSSQNIEIILYPELDYVEMEKFEIETFEFNGVRAQKLSLKPGQLIPIGTVHASYEPDLDDLKLRQLQVIRAMDTLKFSGRDHLLESLRKIRRLDWRLVIN